MQLEKQIVLRTNMSFGQPRNQIIPHKLKMHYQEVDKRH